MVYYGIIQDDFLWREVLVHGNGKSYVMVLGL